MTDQYFSDAEIAVFAKDRTLWEAIPLKLALLHIWARDAEMGVRDSPSRPGHFRMRWDSTTFALLDAVRFTLLRVYAYGREVQSADPLDLEVAIHVRALLMQRFQLKQWPPHPLRWQHRLNKYEYFGIVHLPKELQ